jgi:cold shock CspA family protein
MGRSNETFNKKEKEKRKQKKQQEKKERAEDRKASSGKGKSLDDMMAYIDEYGNITDTPPDLSKRKAISSEDIQISIPKQENLPEDAIRKGIVTMFNESKGYGFIRDQNSQESIFVHVNGLIDRVKENDRVTFETAPGQKGPTAVSVKKA